LRDHIAQIDIMYIYFETMKKKVLSIFCFTILFQFLVIQIRGQETNPEDIHRKLVYLHTDCMRYSAGEFIFFKAYIFQDISLSQTFFVSLIDQAGLEVASGEFPVKNSCASGNLRLSKYLAEGNYILIAYTDLMKNDSSDKIFSEIIEVKNTGKSWIKTDLALDDTIYSSGSQLTAHLRHSTEIDKPVTTTYTYQLTGKTGEIYSGKDKTTKDGRATIAITLPSFQSDDSLKLLVTTLFKGRKTTNGIVIPTRYNHKRSNVYSNRRLPTDEYKHLNIRIKTDRQFYSPDEKVVADIYVSDDKGIPVAATLSISVSDFVSAQGKLPDDETINLPKSESNQTERFFAHYLSLVTRSPGRSYIVQEKNDLEKIRKKDIVRNQMNNSGYRADQSITDIIKQIKPCQIEGSKIMFANSGLNSIGYQDGALIVIDGIKMGTDAGILNSIPVTDISKINVYTNPSEIQRYTGLNSAGVIEIIMKKGPEEIEKKEPVLQNISSALFWEPDILTNNSGKVSFDFLYDTSPAIIISVNGITANGLFGRSAVKLSLR